MRDLANRLRTVSGVCRDRVVRSEQAKKNLELLVERNRIINSQLADVEMAKRVVSSSIKIGKDYLGEKRDSSIRDVKAAIRTASTIIPECSELRLEVANNYAEILTGPVGIEVPFNRVDGGAQRSSVAFFTRASILGNIPYMQMMILDEAFAAMSAETSRNFSQLLRELGKTFQIFIMEQKPEVTESGVEASFEFRLSAKVTNVRRVV